MNYDDTTIGPQSDGIVHIPVNHMATGTCSKCGGPVIAPLVTIQDWRYPIETNEWCMQCGAKPKKEILPAFGPIKEME